MVDYVIDDLALRVEGGRRSDRSCGDFFVRGLRAAFLRCRCRFRPVHADILPSAVAELNDNFLVPDEGHAQEVSFYMGKFLEATIVSLR